MDLWSSPVTVNHLMMMAGGNPRSTDVLNRSHKGLPFAEIWKLFMLFTWIGTLEVHASYSSSPAKNLTLWAYPVLAPIGKLELGTTIVSLAPWKWARVVIVVPVPYHTKLVPVWYHTLHLSPATAVTYGAKRRLEKVFTNRQAQ
eukprot:scaffold968_cov171-Amphora_coffeaeformis.AAC.7